jgi:hypothetical protein
MTHTNTLIRPHLAVGSSERSSPQSEARWSPASRGSRPPGMSEAQWPIPGSILALLAAYAYRVRREADQTSTAATIAGTAAVRHARREYGLVRPRAHRRTPCRASTSRVTGPARHGEMGVLPTVANPSDSR